MFEYSESQQAKYRKTKEVIEEGDAATIYEHKYWKGSFLASNPIASLEQI